MRAACAALPPFLQAPGRDLKDLRVHALRGGRFIELRSGTVDRITNNAPDDFESINIGQSLTFINSGDTQVACHAVEAAGLARFRRRSAG